MEIFQIKHFQDLNPAEIYAMYQLRAEVFVVEQQCVFTDPDAYDLVSLHIMGMVQSRLMAYARIVPPGEIYPEASIGRVVTAPEVRRNGAGKKLMEKAIQECQSLFPGHSIRIMAQCYLEKFYASFGFLGKGPEFLEDGIPHRMMWLQE